MLFGKSRRVLYLINFMNRFVFVSVFVNFAYAIEIYQFLLCFKGANQMIESNGYNIQRDIHA